MKKLFPIFMIFLCMSVSAQDKTSEPNTIDVSGKAEVFVAPDEVVFSLDVSNIDMNLQKAKEANDETVSKVLMLTKKYSIEPKDVKTDYISFDKKYEYYRDEDNKIFDEDGDEISQKKFKGYEISKTVIVTLRDISKFERFFSEVLNVGITEINSVRFQTSKLRELKDKARELAMKAAYEKAKAMTGAIGQTIGKAISVVEGTLVNRGYTLSGIDSNSQMNVVSTSGNFSRSESMATFAPGAIKVEASVKIRFLLN